MPEIAGIGLLTAFAAGIISFLSPCVLPLVPGYVSFVAGRSVEELQTLSGYRERLAVVGMSLSFVLGFATVFMLLGASATAIGRVMLAYKETANIVGGTFVIVFGLFMSGALRLRWLHGDTRWIHRLEQGGTPWLSYLLGVAFAFGWTPCIGPVLGSILTVSASGAGSGVALLGVYSLGLGVPFLATALFINRFLDNRARLRAWGRPLHIIGGVVMIVVGVAMVTGQLARFSYWLLDVFPWLGRIG
ncbi:Thiol:disulfide interchange protein DsbD [wastewater metagenome]|uniref:Thiol:disulfide interchange protein DsbD n=2 Tax=unclassified sequences TaxID=12908 RepID=A0A5B8RG78_9ZZZZ|nr:MULTISPECIES: cytochrome c biogenesis protein CcdA [Arhodomonas]MCS4505348.1 cytochrome C biogenesis protein CcdA [Arhodomonas aquaeolei]QEA06482.1 thiol:disulfide interchange protein DsbD [uncultured organism]